MRCTVVARGGELGNLSAIRAADMFKIRALHIGRGDRKVAECAGRIQGCVSLFEVNLVAGHWFFTRRKVSPRQAGKATP